MTTPQDETDEEEQVIDQVVRVLEGAYQPESSREELATAIGEALELLELYAEDD